MEKLKHLELYESFGMPGEERSQLDRSTSKDLSLNAPPIFVMDENGNEQEMIPHIYVDQGYFRIEYIGGSFRGWIGLDMNNTKKLTFRKSSNVEYTRDNVEDMMEAIESARNYCSLLRQPTIDYLRDLLIDYAGNVGREITDNIRF